MAQYQDSFAGQPARTSGIEEVSGWAIGFTFFASMLMVMMGGFHIIEGLAAVINDKFYVVRPNYSLSFDVTTWGWIHMLGGVILILAGLGLITGSVLARIVTIILAGISMLWNFYSIPYYPVWSILMIVLAIGVIWALLAHGHDLDVASDT
jgi:hypothetical protein